MLLRHSVPAYLWQLAPETILRVADMSPYHPTRRQFLIGAGGLLLLAPYGCGTEPGQSGQTTSGGTRTVEHMMGRTEIPENLQRIASLDNRATDTFVALGMEPAGITTFTGNNFESYGYLKDELQDTQILGKFVEPNLEGVARLDPDLILGDDLHEDIYDQLSRIAPTVLMEDAGGSFRKYARDFGRVLGVEGKMEERLDEYERNAAKASKELDRAVGDEPVAFLKVRQEEFRLYTNTRLVGPILYGDLGLTPEPLIEEAARGEGYVELSLERIPDLEARHLFLLNQSEEQMQRLSESPLWKKVPAVQEGNVYQASRDTWVAVGVVAAEAVIEDALGALTR